MDRFSNRREAGLHLGKLLALRDFGEPVVVGMPRGGVPVAAEVARELGAPLDIAVVRKIGAPQQPEYAIGAIAEDDASVINQRDTQMLGLHESALRDVVRMELDELKRRVVAYRTECPRIDLTDRTAILVDDGFATGASAVAAARSLRARGARRVILAVPVCARQALDQRPPDASIDEVICVSAPQHLVSVGQWYNDFSPVSDAEVLALLRESRDGRRKIRENQIEIEVHQTVRLGGVLAVPDQPRGVVLFAHGSGSSRTSPRNLMVARTLNNNGFATLLFDLLDPFEAADRAKVFDIPLLADRLAVAHANLGAVPEVNGLSVGYFGASTGGGAALWAAAQPNANVAAVVSRGGRPDLVGDRLPDVVAPTLLIVGGDDPVVIELNRKAMSQMTCHVELAIVPGATHLFDEPGALEKVADDASSWFERHLVRLAQNAIA